MRAPSLLAVTLLVVSQLHAAQQAPEFPTTLTRGPLYDHYVTGNAGDVTPPTHGGLLLAGGGTDQPDAFRWFINKAGGGDIVVLRASGADGYHPFVMRLGGVDSIETFLVHSREASSDPTLLARLGKAEAIFFAGGDQSRYVRYFKDTPVEDLINAAAKRQIPIGGTSAGLAILSEFSYSALYDSSTTAEATADPFHKNITLDRDFLTLPHLSGIITDSHVIERGRLGRTVTFMARLKRDGWLGNRPARAIAIDRETAVLMEPNGSATIVGPKTAYFMEATVAPQRCEAGAPLTFHPVAVYTVTKASTFNLTTWTGTGGAMNTMTVKEGKVTGPEASVSGFQTFPPPAGSHFRR
jgi:cyanophycinase